MARVSRRTAAGGDGTYPNVALDSAYRGKFGGKNFDELSDNQKDEVIKDLEDDSLSKGTTARNSSTLSFLAAKFLGGGS